MSDDHIDELIEAVLRQLKAEGLVASSSNLRSQADNSQTAGSHTHTNISADLVIDSDDPTTSMQRIIPGLENAADQDALVMLMETTTARIGVGRAGYRPKTKTLQLFQSDFAISQDALYREVDPVLLQKFDLFQVETMITEGKEQYLLRPDLGRKLSSEAMALIKSRCVKRANIQICVGDGLSATAIEVNIPKIMPVLISGCQSVGLSLGTPFFIHHCRVGVMNDIGDILEPDVVILLIGERPGLGRAESMSAYMAFQPRSGDTDADREVICNIFDNGGTNPLEAGAYAVQLAQTMMKNRGSGVKMRLSKDSER
ncbi:MAG: hypothetical protein BGO78_13395 [Chloroflexi bacterium 44-23]|nr:MAG: hypothetical protein BGO78_13395 [Chloroflexi bacterium 44-23]